MFACNVTLLLEDKFQSSSKLEHILNKVHWTQIILNKHLYNNLNSRKLTTSHMLGFSSRIFSLLHACYYVINCTQFHRSLPETIFLTIPGVMCLHKSLKSCWKQMPIDTMLPVLKSLEQNLNLLLWCTWHPDLEACHASDNFYIQWSLLHSQFYYGKLFSQI